MTYAMHLTATDRHPLSGRIETDLLKDLFSSSEPASPMLLLSCSEIERRYRELSRALPRAVIHYAVKSNNHPSILAEILRSGGNFDVCSNGEIANVVAAGGDATNLIHSHPIKSIDEFDGAVAAGVNIFVVDNVEEVRKLERYRDRSLKILVRYRIQTDTTAAINLQYKFGCTVEEVLPLAALVEKAGHQFHGLCFHIGSQCVYSDNYVKAIKAAGTLIKQLRSRGRSTRMLDIGGGFPVQYVEPVPSIDELCAPINKALEYYIPRQIDIRCEPGRFLSAGSVTLVCSVIGKSMRDGKLWYYLDDGLYSTFSGIVFDQCRYPVICGGQGTERLSVLAGPTCDSFDVMYEGIMLPEQQIGDRIAFPMTGAYCTVSGTQFNSLRQPEYRIIA